MDQKKLTPVIAVIAIVVIIAVGVFAYKSMQNSVPQNPTASQETGNPNGTSQEAGKMSAYNAGTYNAEGNYTSPGGEESVDVTLTIDGSGTVTEANVVSNAVNPTSKMMQANFISGYKAEVVGKSIDEISLDKVSGSSLTPKGFNEALEEIKTQASNNS